MSYYPQVSVLPRSPWLLGLRWSTMMGKNLTCVSRHVFSIKRISLRPRACAEAQEAIHLHPRGPISSHSTPRRAKRPTTRVAICASAPRLSDTAARMVSVPRLSGGKTEHHVSPFVHRPSRNRENYISRDSRLHAYRKPYLKPITCNLVLLSLVAQAEVRSCPLTPLYIMQL